ncbi:uncharacterized protein [Lolium perenne]|uniref:uncharacterized protein n=1 Tax=Lolium perenne TaxID=4522 RepID=UPI0021F68759|nr:uncharacterized protein LOC127348292 [Lolium perenne]
MGSLMAGWSSHVLQDDNKVGFMRNRSLTKEEVKAFWRQHKKPEVDNDGGTVEVTPPPLASSPHPESPRSLRPSTLSHVRSSPPEMTRTDGGDTDAADSPSTSRDWWTRSSWAFLNEPPPPPQRAGGGVGQGATAAV